MALPRVLWWTDLRQPSKPAQYLVGLLSDMDPVLPAPPRDPVQEHMAEAAQRIAANLDARILMGAISTNQSPATTAAPDSCLTIEKLDAMVEEVTRNMPPPCRLVVHSMVEAQRRADEMFGELMDRSGIDYQAPVEPSTFLGIPIKATKGCPPGTAVFIVESNPPRAYVVEVPD